ncbi:hypothetical protein ACXPWS_10615 [Mycobacterium sp. BMJ-28]
MLTSAKVVGAGSYAPPQSMSNHQLTETLDTNDEWIPTPTGIRHRHIAADGMSTIDLTVMAGAGPLGGTAGSIRPGQPAEPLRVGSSAMNGTRRLPAEELQSSTLAAVGGRE